MHFIVYLAAAVYLVKVVRAWGRERAAERAERDVAKRLIPRGAVARTYVPPPSEAEAAQWKRHKANNPEQYP